MTDFEKVYTENSDFIFKYLYKLCQNTSLAEELTQETFFRAYMNFSSLRDKTKAPVWLCQIAKYVYYQSLDKKRRSKEVTFDEAVEIAMHEEVQKSIEDAEAKLHIYKVIHALPSPMRDVVMLKLTGELSFKEIGNVLGQSENWARVTYYRAKQKILREVSE